MDLPVPAQDFHHMHTRDSASLLMTETLQMLDDPQIEAIAEELEITTRNALILAITQRMLNEHRSLIELDDLISPHDPKCDLCYIRHSPDQCSGQPILPFN